MSSVQSIPQTQQNTSVHQEATEIAQKVFGNVEGTQADKIVELVNSLSLFKTPGGDYYAEIPIVDTDSEGREAGTHTEVWPIRSSKLKSWIMLKYTEKYEQLPNPNSLNSALQYLESRATFSKNIHEVYLRVGYLKEKDTLYIDMCNEEWEAIEIDKEGWRVVEKPPLKFRRANGMLPLPTPQKGGKLEELQEVVNVKTGEQWILYVAWLLGALHPTGPYPTEILQGEKGSAKTSAIRYGRGLFDPNVAPTHRRIADQGAINVKAQNNWIIALDNLSSMPLWLSDQICGLNTGSGDGTRRLYSDDEQVVFSAKRPVCINGIEDLATAGDLADRSVIIQLQTIPKNKRKSEEELDAMYEKMRPRVMGALFDAVSCALRKRKEVKIEDLPRMADFTIWVTAAEESLGWEPGTFKKTYHKNRESNLDIEIDSSPVASAIKAMLREKLEWKGTATTLHKDLWDYVPPERLKNIRWPINGPKMGGELRRVAPALREKGYIVEMQNSGSRLITLGRGSSGASEGSTEAVNGKPTAQTPDRSTSPSRLLREGEGSTGGKMGGFTTSPLREKREEKVDPAKIPPVPPSTAQAAQEAASKQGSTDQVLPTEAVPPDPDPDFDPFLDPDLL